MTEPETPYLDTERAVWDVLNSRRWFGKHVDGDELEQLAADLRDAIRTAIEPWVS